jgi:glycosyltransferase involved in cell wall biosynthesis
MSLLTIILPVYNGEPFITESINSILTQTFTDFKLIVVNDGSKDRTLEILKEIEDPRIKILNKKHTGIIDSFNSALNIVDTKYVARIDSDDFYYPNKFQKQINLLEAEPDIVLIGTGAHYMSQSGKVSKIRLLVPENHDDIINSLFKKDRSIISSTIVIRTSEMKKIGGYSCDILPEEYDLCFRMGKLGYIHNINEPISAIRIHKSFSYKNIQNLLNNYDNIIQKYHADYEKEFIFNTVASSKNVSIVLNRQALYEWLNGSKIKSIYLILKSFTISPMRILKYVLHLN